ncbi:ArnT family glycosyltransferase [Dietzia sp.]|uniref:ArnT family glycosyltransferase n=1 Tax=Dietzia sp. TaxID=1871616 RepID=UPI002FDADE11
MTTLTADHGSSTPHDTPPHSPPRRKRGGGDPPWTRVALAALLLGTAVLYFWNLSENGWANSFYSAAVQAGSEWWKAFFYGSSDAANSITVDKPPASLWLMALSVRLFGLHSFAILLPEVLLGIATVYVVYRTVRRYFGPGAGLLAGFALAITPVAVLMFRFNNPDALLVFLMTLAAWATLRAIEATGRRGVWWMTAVGAILGLAFLTKTLQSFLVIPFFGIAYLVCANSTFRTRVIGSVAAIAALLVGAGWWIAIVELVPSSARPYVGGSQNDSFLELTFGYNGLGRINGNETGSVGGGMPGGGDMAGGMPAGGPGGGAGGGMWGGTGIWRMFDSEQGSQISWLIPAAIILLVAALWFRGRAPRTDMRRAALIVFGGWFLVTMATFSFMSGIFHSYYTVALAPAIAAIVGMGAAEAWQRRDRLFARIVLAAAALAVGIWGFVLLTRVEDYGDWLRILVLATGIAAALGLLVIDRLARLVVTAVLVLAVVSGFSGQAAYAVSTVSHSVTGSIVSAGPSSMGGPGGGGMPGGGPGGMPGGMAGGAPGAAGGTGGTGNGAGAGAGAAGGAQDGVPGGTGTTGTTDGAAGGSRGGGIGGLLESEAPSQEVVDALEENADQFTWVAAAVGSMNASGLQLATEDPVMAIGGFNGSDPSPTLEEFQQYVANGEIHYFVGSGGMGGNQMGGSNASSEISQWVEANFTEVTIGTQTFYDLTAPIHN